ncbi:MAG: hypothetical protein EON47_22090, partial [Acetobacteraceae bacterium]
MMRPMRTGTSPLAWVLPLALLAGCIPSRSGMGVMPPSKGRAAAPIAGPRLAGIPTPPRRTAAAAVPVLASPPPSAGGPEWPTHTSSALPVEPSVTVTTTTALPAPSERAERAT